MMAESEDLNEKFQLLALDQPPPKRLDDLDDDCLLMVLDQLPSEELFNLLQVNKRLNQLAADKIRVKIKAIALFKSSSSFADCDHLNDVNQNQVLVLETLFGKQFDNEFFQEPAKRALFYHLLAKCEEVKSINFGHLTVTGDLLLEMVQSECCQKLECVKLYRSVVTEDEWQLILDKIGQKMIHFTNRTFSNEPIQDRLLAMVAEKCPKISKIDWRVSKSSATSGLLSTMETQLPTSCCVKLCCLDALPGAVFKDVVDELYVRELYWSMLGDSINRLSSLKLFELSLDGAAVRGVKFSGLRRLDFSKYKAKKPYTSESIACIVASQFPQLKEFRFNARAGLTEDDYQALFRNMTTVKKLTIVSYAPDYVRETELLFPGLSIHHLENLETIDIDIYDAPFNWKPNDILEQLEFYVDIIGLLKKLSVDIDNRCHFSVWKLRLQAKIKLLNERQSQVKVSLI